MSDQRDCENWYPAPQAVYRNGRIVFAPYFVVRKTMLGMALVRPRSQLSLDSALRHCTLSLIKPIRPVLPPRLAALEHLIVSTELLRKSYRDKYKVFYVVFLLRSGSLRYTYCARTVTTWQHLRRKGTHYASALSTPGQLLCRDTHCVETLITRGTLTV